MRTLLLCLVLAGALPCQDQPLPDGASLVIVVQEVKGEVDVRTGPKEKWVPAVAGMRIPVGSKICTGIESGAVVSFGTNSVALVSECTVCSIQTFEMRGEELVAGIHLEPGVAQVSVKQLAQFHTDFQVSTPRLTCSVRGSVGWFVSQCDEIPDVVRNEEGHVGANGRNLAAGERTNSNRESNHELALKENLADTTPDGATEAEEELAEQAAGGIDDIASDSTRETDSSPSGGDHEDEQELPHEGEPPEIEAAEAFLEQHDFGDLLDFLHEGPEATGERMNAAQDQWDNVNMNQNTDPIYVQKREAILLLDGFFPFGGILHDHRGIDYLMEHSLLHAYLAENHAEDHAFDGLGGGGDGADEAAWHELAHEAGLRTTIDQATTEMHTDFHTQLDVLTDQQVRGARHDDYHNGNVGFDSMVADLHALSDQAATGEGFDTDLYGKTLVQMLHASVHERIVDLPVGPSPGAYDAEHQQFHTGVVDDLLDTLATEGIEAMIGRKADLLDEFWHNDTGVAENVQPGETGYDQHEALDGALDEFTDKANQAAADGGE